MQSEFGLDECQNENENKILVILAMRESMFHVIQPATSLSLQTFQGYSLLPGEIKRGKRELDFTYSLFPSAMGDTRRAESEDRVSSALTDTSYQLPITFCLRYKLSASSNHFTCNILVVVLIDPADVWGS